MGNYNQYGVSSDGTRLMCIGRPSAPGESSKYGYKFYKTVFERKCPHCGSSELYWSIFWAGNETSSWGTFPATGRREGGSIEGHVFCKKCDADYSCIEGKEHISGSKYQLKIVTNPVESSKEEAYKLKQGGVADSGSTSSSSGGSSTPSSYGDMILDLIKPLDGEVMALQYENKVKVCRIPNPCKAKLWATEGLNIVDDSVSVADVNPETTNVLYVKWSDGLIIVRIPELIERFGEKEEIIKAVKYQSVTEWVADSSTSTDSTDASDTDTTSTDSVDTVNSGV